MQRAFVCRVALRCIGDVTRPNESFKRTLRLSVHAIGERNVAQCRLTRALAFNVTMTAITYPFTPKSTAKLVPGQYWAIPLSNGTYACGRVVQVLPKGVQGSRVAFLAGLMNWNSSEPPDTATIAGADFLRQGHAHLKTITENGGTILGQRPLKLDNLSPWQFRGAQFFHNSHVYKGLIKTRPQTPDDDELPVLETWGFKFITRLAEREFVRHETAS